MREFLLKDWPMVLVIVGGLWLLAARLWTEIKRRQAEQIGRPLLWIYCQKGSGEIVSHNGDTAKDRPEGLDDTKPHILIDRQNQRRCGGFCPSQSGLTFWRIEAAAAHYTLIDPIGGRQSFGLQELWYYDGSPTQKLKYLFAALEANSFYAVYRGWEKMNLSLKTLAMTVDFLINQGLITFSDAAIRSQSLQDYHKKMAASRDPYSFDGLMARAFLAQVERSLKNRPN